jgi:hypothetical protein
MQRLHKVCRMLVMCLALSGLQSAWSMDADCEGELTPEQQTQMASCAAHPACRLVVSLAKTCQSVRTFLARLPAGSRPVNDGAMEAALAGGEGELVCWRRFNYQACKAYLFGADDGGGTIASVGTTEGLSAGTPPSASATQRLSKSGAEFRRDAIRKEDDSIYNRLDQDCRAATSPSCLTVLALLDKLLVSLKDANEDPEYLAHLPPMQLHSPAKVERLGWRKQADGWGNPEADRAMAACERDRLEVSDLVDQRAVGARVRADGFKAACAPLQDTYSDLAKLWASRLGKAGAGSVAGQSADFERGVLSQAELAARSGQGLSDAEVQAAWQRKQQQLAEQARASEQARMRGASQDASLQELARLKTERENEQWASVANGILGIAQTYADAKQDKQRSKEVAGQRQREMLASSSFKDAQLLQDWQEVTASGRDGGPFVEVCVRDHECIDGDALQVSVNGLVVARTELVSEWRCTKAHVSSGVNSVQILALNGTGHKGSCNFSDVNTGQISVTGIGRGGQSRSPEVQTWKIRGGAGSTSSVRVVVE